MVEFSGTYISFLVQRTRYKLVILKKDVYKTTTRFSLQCSVAQAICGISLKENATLDK